jgi:hypothetical protein
MVPRTHNRSNTPTPSPHLHHIHPLPRQHKLPHVALPSHPSDLFSLFNPPTSYTSAGRSATSAYDDVWILSLPQFRWTQVFTGARPNYGATCHLVGKKQILVLGGIDQDMVCQGSPYLATFDMTNLKWLGGFVKEDKKFRVPKAVWEGIGGS